MKTNKPAAKLTLNKATLKNLAVKTGVNAGASTATLNITNNSACSICVGTTIQTMK